MKKLLLIPLVILTTGCLGSTAPKTPKIACLNGVKNVEVIVTIAYEKTIKWYLKGVITKKDASEASVVLKDANIVLKEARYLCNTETIDAEIMISKIRKVLAEKVDPIFKDIEL